MSTPRPKVPDLIDLMANGEALPKPTLMEPFVDHSTITERNRYRAAEDNVLPIPIPDRLDVPGHRVEYTEFAVGNWEDMWNTYLDVIDSITDEAWEDTY